MTNLSTFPNPRRNHSPRQSHAAHAGGQAAALARKPPAAVALDELAIVSSSVTRRRRLSTRFLIPAALTACADVIGLVLAGTAAALLPLIAPQFTGAFLPPLWVWIAAILPAYVIAGLYPGIAAHPVDELRRLTLATTAALGTAFAIEAATGVPLASLLPGFICAWLIAVIAVPAMRGMVRSATQGRSWATVPTLVLGAGRTARSVVRALNRNPQLGLRPVGVLDDRAERYQQNAWAPDVPYLGPISEVPRAAAEYNVEHAIIAMPGLRSSALRRLISRYTPCLPHIVVVPGMVGSASLWVQPRNVGGILGIEISQLLVHAWPRVVKRTFDVVLSAAALIALAPVFALLCLLIRLESRGPALYFQKRVGRGGAMFRLWKFRSMYCDCDHILQRALRDDPALAAEWAKRQKLRKDPRVTIVGRVLRKLSLDELPQLWNVLIGDMSLVGPRPIVDEEIGRYRRRFASYALVRPGITGLWQVSGRNNTTYARRIELDEYYVRNWSVWLDIYILARTVKTVLTCEGAF